MFLFNVTCSKNNFTFKYSNQSPNPSPVKGKQNGTKTEKNLFHYAQRGVQANLFCTKLVFKKYSQLLKYNYRGGKPIS